MEILEYMTHLGDSEFGGDLYLTEGSHGCVNTPYEQVEIIYQNIDIGAPVVVY